MAKNNILEWDTTASNNTDIAGIGILGTNAVNNFDDAFRTEMAQVATGLVTRFTSRSSGYTAVKADHNQASFFTAAATLSLTAAATLTAGWQHWVYANGGDIVIDPNGAETINGLATITVPSGASAFVRCNGTAFYAQIFGVALAGVGVQGFLNGLTLSNNGSDATNDIDIAVGGAAADTAPFAVMSLASILTKRLDAAWAVGSGNGGLDTGSIANTSYHIWLIQRSDTGVVDALFSASATAPTMPTNYDRKRRIGSIIRVSAAILLFTQVGDIFNLATAVSERSSSAAVASGLLQLTAVPSGIVVSPLLSISQQHGTAGNAFTQVATAGKTLDPTDAYTQTLLTSEVCIGKVRNIFTDTSARVQFGVVIGSGTLAVNTLSTTGWIDTRGRL